MSERAKIFVPFNPLKGFSEALRAKEREVEASALDDHGGNDLEAPDRWTIAAERRADWEESDAATDLEHYLTAEDVAERKESPGENSSTFKEE